VNKIVFLLFSIFYQSVLPSKMAIGTKNGQLPRKLLFARDRIVIKTDDFPVGTTELIYRITLGR
jgi:hypothetical protein